MTEKPKCDKCGGNSTSTFHVVNADTILCAMCFDRVTKKGSSMATKVSCGEAAAIFAKTTGNLNEIERLLELEKLVAKALDKAFGDGWDACSISERLQKLNRMAGSK